MDGQNTHPSVIDTFKSIIINGSDKNYTLEFPPPVFRNEFNANHLTVTYNLIGKSLQAQSAKVFNQSRLSTISLYSSVYKCPSFFIKTRKLAIAIANTIGPVHLHGRIQGLNKDRTRWQTRSANNGGLKVVWVNTSALSATRRGPDPKRPTKRAFFNPYS